MIRKSLWDIQRYSGREVQPMLNNSFKRCLCAALILMLSGIPALAMEASTYEIVYSTSNPIPQIAANTRPAIVQVTNSVESWDPATRKASVDPMGFGSACYIREDEDGEGGYLLTNYHVVQDGDAFSATWLDGTEMELDLVGYDDGTDIAVLRFDEAAPEDAKPIPMGDSDALQIGELAICIGNPGTGDEVLFGTVTAGIISGLERGGINAENFTRSVSVIQTDAPINGGNSGGALLNAKGQLVGIPTLKMGASYTMIYEGLGFCVPINSVKDYIEQIIEKGVVVRPRMGVTVVSIDGPDEAMRRYPPCGAQVYTVEPGTPADKAGLKVNDVVAEVNGVRIKSSDEMVAEIDKCEVGDTVTMKIYRYNYDAEGNISGGYKELEVELKLQILD